METQEIVKAFKETFDGINNYINEHGQIQPSSEIIKTWHTYDNTRWALVLWTVTELDRKGMWTISPTLLRDCELLKEFIGNYHRYSDNLLYPTIQETKSLSKGITHITIPHKNDKYCTVKTLTFSVMMRIREMYCDILGIDLPNADSSKGLLDPSPQDRLLDFGNAN